MDQYMTSPSSQRGTHAAEGRRWRLFSERLLVRSGSISDIGQRAKPEHAQHRSRFSSACAVSSACTTIALKPARVMAASDPILRAGESALPDVDAAALLRNVKIEAGR